MVGRAHVTGIVANWKQHIDITKLPKSSRKSKVKKAQGPEFFEYSNLSLKNVKNYYKKS